MLRAGTRQRRQVAHTKHASQAAAGGQHRAQYPAHECPQHSTSAAHSRRYPVAGTQLPALTTPPVDAVACGVVWQGRSAGLARAQLQHKHCWPAAAASHGSRAARTEKLRDDLGGPLECDGIGRGLRCLGHRRRWKGEKDSGDLDLGNLGPILQRSKIFNLFSTACA
jgi:hypothetical protein